MMNAVKQQSLNFTDIKGVVAVDEHVPSAGAIVWWRLSGRVDYDTFKAAWLAAGLSEEDLPTACSPATALRRAVDDLREKRVLVRPLGRRKKTASDKREGDEEVASRGFVVVRERVSEDETEELDHEKVAKITLDVLGRVKVTTLRDGSADETARLLKTVTGQFDFHLESLDTGDFSSWLVRMMPRLDAVSLRDKGGVYFVPFHAVQKVANVVGVLRQVTEHVVNRVPAMRSDDAVDAILDAITQEAQDEAAHLEQDLADMKYGEVGFQNRVERCEAVDAKVARYEELLGRKLEGLRERLETIRANLTIAVMKTAKKEDLE